MLAPSPSVQVRMKILKSWNIQGLLFHLGCETLQCNGLPELRRFRLEKRNPEHFYLSNSCEESSDTWYRWTPFHKQTCRSQIQGRNICFWILLLLWDFFILVIAGLPGTFLNGFKLSHDDGLDLLVNLCLRDSSPENINFAGQKNTKISTFININEYLITLDRKSPRSKSRSPEWTCSYQ